MIFLLSYLYNALTLTFFLLPYRLDLFVELFKYWWRHVTKIFKIKWGNTWYIWIHVHTAFIYCYFLLLEVCMLSIIFSGMILMRMMSNLVQLSTKRTDTLHWNRTNFLHSPSRLQNSQVEQLVLWYSLTTITVKCTRTIIILKTERHVWQKMSNFENKTNLKQLYFSKTNIEWKRIIWHFRLSFYFKTGTNNMNVWFLINVKCIVVSSII